VNVYVTTRDSLGRLVLVRTIVRDLSETKGSHNHTWLGDTEKGIFAPAGLYTGILQIQDASFETSVRIFHF
jgi:flagellar hook assembly protein FlgD